MSKPRWQAEILPRSPGEAGPGSGREAGPARRYAAPTFGLVTALPEEFHAMRTLLDAPVDTRVIGDRAGYVAATLPSLDERLAHTVILTLTADIGTHAAADACRSLVAAFPSVNAVVIAGIAAGVPLPGCPERHVRLGDLVVATRGVVDYRHVVQGVHGDDLRQPFPRPSVLLNRADRMLHAGEYARQRPWEASLDVSGRAELLAFRRPPDETDVLRDPADPDRTIPHPARRLSGHRRGRPKVHRGRIGSADVSMRTIMATDTRARSGAVTRPSRRPPTSARCSGRPRRRPRGAGTRSPRARSRASPAAHASPGSWSRCWVAAAHSHGPSGPPNLVVHRHLQGQQHLDVLPAVGAEDGHPVALADAPAVQGAGQLVDPPVDLGE